MEIKRFFAFVPNTITSFNVLSGCLSIVFAFEHNLLLAGGFIFIAAVFDFFDGMSARLLKAYSDMGKELDSLADMISFGFAPSVIVFVLVRDQLAPGQPLSALSFSRLTVLLIPFIIAVFSALRLAKFNIDARQTESFIGLATPANAMLWASVPFILHFHANSTIAQLIYQPVLLLVLSVIMSFLLVAEIPMFSLKFKNLRFKQNKTRFIFLFIALLLLIFLNLSAIPLIIICYVLASVITNLVCRSKNQAIRNNN